MLFIIIACVGICGSLLSMEKSLPAQKPSRLTEMYKQMCEPTSSAALTDRERRDFIIKWFQERDYNFTLPVITRLERETDGLGSQGTTAIIQEWYADFLNKLRRTASSSAGSKKNSTEQGSAPTNNEQVSNGPANDEPASSELESDDSVSDESTSSGAGNNETAGNGPEINGPTNMGQTNNGQSNVVHVVEHVQKGEDPLDFEFKMCVVPDIVEDALPHEVFDYIDKLMMCKEGKLLINGEKKMLRPLIMYGPTGTGKTTAAEYIGAKSEYLFKDFMSTIILSPWQAGACSRLKQVFDKAIAEKKHCIICINEIDGVVKEGQNISQATENVCHQMLGELDRLKTNPFVFVIFTTNHLDYLPNTFLNRCAKLFVPNAGFGTSKKIIANQVTKNNCTITDEEVRRLAEATHSLDASNREKVEIADQVVSDKQLQEWREEKRRQISESALESRAVTPKEQESLSGTTNPIASSAMTTNQKENSTRLTEPIESRSVTKEKKESSLETTEPIALRAVVTEKRENQAETTKSSRSKTVIAASDVTRTLLKDKNYKPIVEERRMKLTELLGTGNERRCCTNLTEPMIVTLSRACACTQTPAQNGGNAQNVGNPARCCMEVIEPLIVSLTHDCTVEQIEEIVEKAKICAEFYEDPASPLCGYYLLLGAYSVLPSPRKTIDVRRKIIDFLITKNQNAFTNESEKCKCYIVTKLAAATDNFTLEQIEQISATAKEMSQMGYGTLLGPSETHLRAIDYFVALYLEREKVNKERRVTYPKCTVDDRLPYGGEFFPLKPEIIGCMYYNLRVNTEHSLTRAFIEKWSKKFAGRVSTYQVSRFIDRAAYADGRVTEYTFCLIANELFPDAEAEESDCNLL